jgi:hypothetical protein
VQGKESWEKDMTGSERLDAQDGETIQPFRDTTEFGIDEDIVIPVPPLLDEKTIRQVKQHLVANRRWLHKPPRSIHDYLLSGRVFCSECGGSMRGQVFKNGNIYYAHNYAPLVTDCPLRPRPLIPARKLEGLVIRKLFEMFGNPAVIERAVKAAIPDCDKAIERQRKLEADIASVEKARGRIIGLVVREAITEQQAEKELMELKQRDRLLREQLDNLKLTLQDVPDEESLRVYTERIEDAFGQAFYEVDGDGNKIPRKTDTIIAYDDNGEYRNGGNDLATLQGMSRDDQRKLIQAVFNAPLADGSPAGIYLTPTGKKIGKAREFAFSLRGRLQFEFESCVPSSTSSAGSCDPRRMRPPRRCRRPRTRNC